MRRLYAVMVMVLVAAAGADAQDRPYLGKWSVNSAKSDLRGVTATYRDLGGGRVEVSGMGQKETFVVGRDGKDYPWPGGLTISWRDLGPNRIETTLKRDGKVLSVGESVLSADGNTNTMVVKSATPNVPESTTVFARVSGGPGVFGTWRMAEIQGGLEIVPAGDAVVFRWIGYAEATCRFDGKDCPIKGDAPNGSTMSLRETGQGRFEYQDKTNGKMNYTSVFTVSADGKTLTEEETQATGEKRRIVYDRTP